MARLRLFEEGLVQKVGRYRPAAFEIESNWRPERAVYVWTQGEGAALSPIRVGIACGPTGLGGRFDHYNKWLAGRFKPNDMREQKVRSVFIEGLGPAADVWAFKVPDKPTGLDLESELRQAWGSGLHLDLMVRDSWGKRQMNDWRAAGRPTPVIPPIP